MLKDTQYEAHERVCAEAKKDAHLAIAAANIPPSVDISEDSLTGIGTRSEDVAKRTLSRLKEECGAHLPQVVGLSIRLSRYSLENGAAYFIRARKEGFVATNPYTQRFTTPEGYGAMEGVAWTLYGCLCENANASELEPLARALEFELDEFRLVVERAAALHWFALAAKELREGSLAKGLDLLGEAMEAIAIADTGRIIAAVLKEERLASEPGEVARRVLSENGLKGADATHRKSREQKAEVFSWLNQRFANIREPNLSAAAKELEKMFARERITLYRWALEWKRLRGLS